MMKSEDLVRRMLVDIGEDPERDGLKDTPSRVVKSWGELFAGYNEDPRAHLSKQFEASSAQMIHVNGIDFFSTCEHHMLPFHGTVDVAYIPKSRVVGLSKFARLVDGYARRLQIQERMTNEVADAIESAVDTLGVAVRVRAKHLCMVARGAKNPGAAMVTTALRGYFIDRPEVRSEWQSALPW